MKFIKRLIATSLCCLATYGAQAQDPSFTQFYSNPIYLNPAFAGSNGCPRFAVNYRNQWPSLSGNYVTYAASYDQYIKQLSGGIGVIATHDVQGQGTIQTTSLALIYSYHLKVNRKFSIMFGAQAGYYQKSLNWDKLTFGDQIDDRKGFIYQTADLPRGGRKGYFDASAGIVGYTENFFFGASVHHLNMPNESLIIGESRLPMRFTGHAGAEIKIGSKSKYSTKASIMPNVIYQYMGGFQELNIGTYFKYGIFTAGVWYRTSDAFIITAGIRTNQFRIGYSYDVTTSKLNNNISGGSHEVSLGLNLACKKRIQQFRTISCPSF